jgi:hypothetical protein
MRIEKRGTYVCRLLLSDGSLELVARWGPYLEC